jgi:hypothetical protein
MTDEAKRVDCIETWLFDTEEGDVRTLLVKATGEVIRRDVYAAGTAPVERPSKMIHAMRVEWLTKEEIKARFPQHEPPKWTERFDDRDDDDVAWNVWSQRLRDGGQIK